MAVNESDRTYQHPFYTPLLNVPGLSVAVAPLDQLLTWGLKNSLWIFPMATSCCGIEFMAAAASRVDLDRMGTIVRGTPRQAEVMVIAGTITVKMAPRVKKLWDQMPEPKWAIAMGSCAISGDFYRDLYPTIPGIDTVLPVDVYVPGCPPNPEALMHGLLRLQERIEAVRAGKVPPTEVRPETAKMLTSPNIGRLGSQTRAAGTDALQLEQSGLPSPDTEEHQPDYAYELDVIDTFVSTAASSLASTPSREPDAVEALLRDRFGVTDFPKDAPPLVDAAHHREVAKALKQAGFEMLTCITASHWPATETAPERHEVAATVRSLGPGSRTVTWRVSAPAASPVDSLMPVFPSADWLEREQFDLVGVRFEGHPDLRRIMLPEDWVGHPLRKDYASDTACHPWR